MTTLESVYEINEPRLASRLTAELKALVQVKGPEGEMWKEVADVTTLSRNGAGLKLSRRCAVGRLVSLVLQMPREFRAYDEDKDLYPVLGIVQYCNEGLDGATKVFHIGLGLVGKTIPESYKADPTQNYRITGMNREGLWNITETGRRFRNRKNPRYWLSIPVTISVINKEDRSITREDTYTRNVGAGGVSIVSTLDAKPGDKVKFACADVNFYAMAVVRNAMEGDPSTLHLQFVGDEFPVEKLLRMQAAA